MMPTCQLLPCLFTARYCPLNLGLGLSATVARETDAPVGGYVVNASVAAEQVATDHMEVVRQRLADVLNLPVRRRCGDL